MHEIVTRVEIAASADAVWRALTDFRAYARWNPVIRRISGVLAPGAVLSVLFHPEGKLPVWFRAKVSVAQPNREFRWTGKLLAPPIFAGDHYFILRAITPERVELVQGEIFSGALASFLYRMLAGYNRSGFVAMNEALKTYVESERLARPAGNQPIGSAVR